MDLGLKDMVVVVTGAASGIGAAIAGGFSDEGSITILVDIDSNGLHRTAEERCRKTGVIKICDVSNQNEVKKLFEEIDRDFGRLHVLANCAAVSTADYVENIRDEDLERILRINIKGYIYTTKYALPIMKKTGYGRLIYINSNSGLKASGGLSLYSGSKYFNRGFAISVALEAGKYGITSNSICPSDIYPEDELGPKSWKSESLIRISLEKEGVNSLEELIKKRTAANPMRRSCTTGDVANLALFLASRKAGFINGQSIGVNGGSVPL